MNSRTAAPSEDTDDTPPVVQDEIAAEVESNTPPIVQDAMPVEMEDDTPPVVQDAMPVDVEDEAPPVVQDAVPVDVEDETPSVVQDAMPVDVEDEAPSVVQDTVPVEVEDEAPPVAQDAVPVEVEDDTPPVVQDAVPVEVEDEAPPVAQDAVPVEVEDDTPPVVQDAVPVEVEDNTPPVMQAHTPPEEEEEDAPVSYDNPPQRLDPTQISPNTTLDVDGGRTTTLDIASDDDIASVKVLEGPEHGNLTVNPDNTLALVMSGSAYSGTLSATVEVTYADGSTDTNTLNLNVSEPAQELGWGQAQHYMLEEDEAGNIVVETGDNHRPVYVTESEDGLTRSDIAALEGLEEEDITKWWLLGNPEYGGSEEMALSTDVGLDLWEVMNHKGFGLAEPSSHWLLFENGYTYEDLQTFLPPGSTGEDELHPLHITSWGDGPRAVINDEISFFHTVGSNIVISDLTVTGGARMLLGSNILFDNVTFTDNEVNLQNIDGLTLHDSEIHDVRHEAPAGEDWHPFVDRSTGLYGANIDGFLIEGSTFHHNAWAEDYEEEDGGQPPSQYSHNIYLQFNTFDVTFRDNIVSQGASFGAQFRGGVFAEDNAFIDNNIAVNFLGGDYNDAGPIGNFTFFADNLVTSGGQRDAEQIGGRAWGIYNDAINTTLLDNIVAHLANPNDLEEIEARDVAGPPVIRIQDPFYDDTAVYAWTALYNQHLEAEQNANIDGLDPAQLDQITIQNFAQAVLGNPEAGIAELMEYVLSQPDSEFSEDVSAQDIIDFFQVGFGLAADAGNVESHRFIPNDLAGGTRWDNAINWSSDQTPDDGDTVDLGGNWVQFGDTVSLQSLDLGDGGQLHVNFGRLTVEGDLEAGDTSGLIDIDGAGQFWTNGFTSDSALNIDIEGGRFANTGDVSGQTSIHVSDGQAILATDQARMTLGEDSALRIDGSQARVGFDGDSDDHAILQVTDGGTLSFVSDTDGFSTIEEFRSGAFGDDTADVASGVSLNGTLQLDLSAQTSAGDHTLIDVDALQGMFDDIHVYGLADTLDANLVFDYETDALTLEISDGSGTIGYDVLGDANDSTSEAEELWAALTAGQGVYDDAPPELHLEEDLIPEFMDL